MQVNNRFSGYNQQGALRSVRTSVHVSPWVHVDSSELLAFLLDGNKCGQECQILCMPTAVICLRAARGPEPRVEQTGGACGGEQRAPRPHRRL
jgi:hypothetical protein